jgi:Holliday junction resolvase RusA-like endonuclease
MSEKITVRIKPLSVNDAWRGRRFKTSEYKQFENAVMALLPKTLYIPVNHYTNEMEIYLNFGVSSKGFDWDNAIKPFVDVLQKKYGFNDNKIYKAVIEKTIVKKGDEFIRFELK